MEAKIIAVSLNDGVRLIGRQLISRVTHGNWLKQCRSLKVQSQITRYVVTKGCVKLWILGKFWAWAEVRRWSSRYKMSLKGKIGFVDFLLNDTERIWWNNRVCSIRHEKSHGCCKYGQNVQQHWTQDMTKS